MLERVGSKSAPQPVEKEPLGTTILKEERDGGKEGLERGDYRRCHEGKIEIWSESWFWGWGWGSGDR